MPESNLVLVSHHSGKQQKSEITSMLQDVRSLLLTTLATAIFVSACIVALTLLFNW